MKERAKQLLKDNPKLTLKQFKEITGLSRNLFYALKKEIIEEERNSYEEIALKIELKRKLHLELISALKKAGYINAKQTFLERG